MITNPTTNNFVTQEYIVEQVKAENKKFFKTYPLSLKQANFAFSACCANKKDFAFTNLILKFEPSGIIEQCIYYERPDLLCDIIDNYGISLMPMINVIFSYIIAWSHIPHLFCCFKKVIEVLPNHTQKVLQHDKCYGVADEIYYGNVYNRILNKLLTSEYEIPLLAFELLAQKKFPINHDNANLIINKKQPTFYVLTHRLNKASKVNIVSPHIAQHKILVKEGYGVTQGKLTQQQTMLHKHRMLKELKEDLPIPDYIFRQFKNYPYDNGAKVCSIPDEKTYQWIDKIGKRKPYVLSFINRHFYYDKVKFYKKLESNIYNSVDDLNNQDIDNNFSTSSSKVKI
jgi:hypothetical protein